MQFDASNYTVRLRISNSKGSYANVTMSGRTYLSANGALPRPARVHHDLVVDDELHRREAAVAFHGKVDGWTQRHRTDRENSLNRAESDFPSAAHKDVRFRIDALHEPTRPYRTSVLH